MAAQTGIKITSDTSEFKKGLEDSKKATSSFRSELRNAKKDALNLTHEFRSLSDEMKKSDYGKNLQKQMQEAIQKAAELQDTMEDTNREIKNLASDTQFADGMKMMAGTIGNVSSALVALTGDSENMKRVLMDIAKIQATVQAVKSLTDAFQKQNRVLLANPYVKVAALISALGVTIYECAKKQDDATISAEKYKKSMEEISTAANIAKMTIYELTQTAANNAKIQDAVSEFTHLGESIHDLEERQRELRNWEKWYHRDISKEYEENEKQIQRLIEKRNFEQNLIRKYEGENELIEDAYKKREAAAKKAAEAETKANTTKTSTQKVYSSGLSDPKYFKTPEIKPIELKGEIAQIEIKGGLEVVPNEVKDKYLSALRFLGEEGQKAFWEAVERGDSYEEAFNNITGKFDTLLDSASKIQDAAKYLSDFGNAFSSLGQSFKLPALNIMGVVMQSVANIALAATQAILQFTGMGPFGWVAGIATVLPTMLTTIATIKNATSGFADGGIIKGATTIGDYNLARVNDGEMILNNRQQSNLFDMINNGVQRDFTINNGGKVEFEIKGQKLVGVLRNYDKKMSKV